MIKTFARVTSHLWCQCMWKWRWHFQALFTHFVQKSTSKGGKVICVWLKTLKTLHLAYQPSYSTVYLQSCTVLSCTVLYCTVLYCTESVPRREEGSTGKYQHEVEGVPEGAARGNSWDRMLVFSCNPDSSQGTDIIQLIKVMKLNPNGPQSNWICLTTYPW